VSEEGSVTHISCDTYTLVYTCLTPIYDRDDIVGSMYGIDTHYMLEHD